MSITLIVALVIAFLVAEAWVLVYFFIIRAKRADDAYEKALERIYGKS